MTPPRSPFDKVGGIYYFARMLDKIRLADAGDLSPDYLPFLGQGLDGRCCRYLHVDYSKLKEQVLAGASDEDAFNSSQKTGKELNDEEILVWNAFISKRGWNDEASDLLAKQKQQNGLSDRDDILTFFHFFEVDEKRQD